MKNSLFFFILLFLACNQTPSTTTNQSEPIPKKVSLPNYQIIDKHFRKPFKASWDIRLDKQISEAEIKAIANHLKSSHPDYDNYFITYLLPDMEQGNGAWATSHFNPSLNINILGATSEEEERMKNIEIPEGKILGKWYDNSPISGNSTIIYQQGKKYKARRLYKDGSFGDDDLFKKGNKFSFDTYFDEYMVIEKDGTLGWYDDTGKFLVVKKLE